jgi:hypothetical protein
VGTINGSFLVTQNLAKEVEGKKEDLERLINNDHVWTADDIKAVLRGRDLINQWKIS